MLKKVLLFSCEPGGAEVIIPVARLLAETGNYEVTVTGYGYAIERFERQGLPYTLVQKIGKNDISFLNRFAPDLVITSATSIPTKDMSEKHLWYLARQAGTKSIALLDQWQNYSLRFSGVTELERLAYLPDAINCIDEIGKKEMIDEGFDCNILHPLGHPYLDRLSLIADQLDPSSIRKSVGISPDINVILFVSEAIEEHYGTERGYTQHDALQTVLKNINVAKAQLILVKLHPKDDITKFKEIQASFPQHTLLFISNELMPLECIVISNRVVGMTSIMLIEAYILGKPVVSVQPNLKVVDPLVLSRHGYVPIICSSNFELNVESETLSDSAQTENKVLAYRFLGEKFLSLVEEMILPSPLCNAQPDGNQKVFLATTALEEFWDTTKPIVFLGEWCLLHSRRSFWGHINGLLIESPFNNDKVIRAADHYVSELYERLLPILGSTLNTIHGTLHSQRYWRILIGPWLMHYLPAIYDRYVHLKHALEQYPDCTTIALSESSFVFPSDTSDFFDYISNDLYNLQIYTRILTELGKNFPQKTTAIKQELFCDKPANYSWQRRAIDYLIRIYLTVGVKLSPSIVLSQSYFSRLIEIRFLIKSIGKVFPILPRLPVKHESPCNSVNRKNLPPIKVGTSEFEQCLSAMLLSDIPKCFVERYCNVKSEAQAIFPKTPKAIFSANAWYVEEAFKQWAALSTEQGTLLAGTSHSCPYGGWAHLPVEDHETSIVDLYYSWGWERTDCIAKVIPMPATKLLGRKKIGASNHKQGILCVLTTRTRYLMRFSTGLASAPKHFQSYLLWHSRFAKTLTFNIMANIRIRPHKLDYGWGMIQRLNEYFPGAPIEAWDVPFQESLINCRLYVCDHCSTTFAEALAVNKPTILFWNPHSNEMRPEAQPYYDLLRKSGILFDTPESAGEAVNQIYDDIETWWNNPERQNTINIFCERFARNSPDAFNSWVTEFKRIAAMSSRQ